VFNAVWILAMLLCGNQPGNITPIPKQLRTSDNVLIPPTLDLDDKRQQQLYARTCGHCVLSPTCKWNVPGGAYYQGLLVRRGPRLVFPFQEWFF
jgi:hypothetical protein